MTPGPVLRLHTRRQELRRDERQQAHWRVVGEALTVPANSVALLLCDVWDNHWCRGAVDRVERMVPRLALIVEAARKLGVTIIHAPSECISFYADHPARRNTLALPLAPLPPLAERDDPPLPISDVGGGCDTLETPTPPWPWTRQHPGITLAESDFISDDGQEVWNILAARGIAQLAIAGVHTNMCILRRPFAIKAMVRRGFPIYLVRDLTDAMYDPRQPPYVSHEEGTRLVIDYIEKFWCPTILGDDLTRDL